MKELEQNCCRKVYFTERISRNINDNWENIKIHGDSRFFSFQLIFFRSNAIIGKNNQVTMPRKKNRIEFNSTECSSMMIRGERERGIKNFQVSVLYCRFHLFVFIYFPFILLLLFFFLTNSLLFFRYQLPVTVTNQKEKKTTSSESSLLILLSIDDDLDFIMTEYTQGSSRNVSFDRKRNKHKMNQLSLFNSSFYSWFNNYDWKAMIC